VHTDLLGGSSTKDVSPELLAFLQRPRIGALIDRDDELGDGALASVAFMSRIWRSLASVAFMEGSGILISKLPEIGLLVPQ
jgi:hypothetical protein